MVDTLKLPVEMPVGWGGVGGVGGGRDLLERGWGEGGPGGRGPPEIHRQRMLGHSNLQGKERRAYIKQSVNSVWHVPKPVRIFSPFPKARLSAALDRRGRGGVGLGERGRGPRGEDPTAPVGMKIKATPWGGGIKATDRARPSSLE